MELNQLKDAVKESLLQRFEYTMDLAWKIAKRYLREYQGFDTQSEMGPKPVIRLCAELGMLNAEKWLHYLEDRNMISHDYSGAKANVVLESIPEFFKEVNRLYLLLSEKITKQ
jgi:nucleotidyltransferase substrate binding protein (TIGR01987 family)